jgi:hypothetical protein
MLANDTNDLGAYGGLRGSGRASYSQYATRFMTDIYHLVQPGRWQTVCGLRISRVTALKANTLQLVTEVPNNLTMCKHCERIRGQDSEV